MRMRTVILLCIGAASLTGLAASGILIRDGISRYVANRTAGQAVHVADLLLAIPPRLSAERGPYNVVLIRDSAATQADHTEIATDQAATDDAFAAALNGIRSSNYAATRTQVAAVETMWSELKALRARIGPLFDVPSRQREPGVWPRTSDAMLRYNDRVIDLVDGLDPWAAAANGELAS
jgi:hypothetical protein